MITQYLNTILSLSNHNNKRIYPLTPPLVAPAPLTTTKNTLKHQMTKVLSCLIQ